MRSKKIGKNIQLFNKKLSKKLPLISNLKLVNWDSVDITILCFTKW